ncbi:MAG TPA: hypothetical protein VGH76_27715 [Actinomycetospora sp.]|uniref:hypothetical protein n=1 Tax=Actinomycetospora sp. TaxID=1872135 RepID=UPI002F42F75B
MTFDDPAVAQARTATDALRELERSGPLLADPTLRRRWAVDLLDELASLADALPGAVEVATGDTGPDDVTTLAEELAEAIRRRRDDLGVPERAAGPALPAVGSPEGHSSRGPKHRAQRHLRPVR